MSATPPDVLCVYRRRNASHVRALVAAVLRTGGSMYLWALDEVDPSLTLWTVGCGPGGRLALLNTLDAKSDRQGPLVICDDDVAMPPDALRRLLWWGRVAKLDLFQPSHVSHSHVNHDVTRRRRGSVVRLTRFVEVGPLVAFSSRVRALATPFPEELGMGWGLDLRWSTLVDEGFRLAIVDAVAIAHLSPAAVDYTTDDEEAALAAETAAVGASHLSALHVPLAYWPFPPKVLAGVKRVRQSVHRRQAGG